MQRFVALVDFFGTASRSDWKHATSQSGMMLKHDTSHQHYDGVNTQNTKNNIIRFLNKGSDSEVLSENHIKCFTAL